METEEVLANEVMKQFGLRRVEGVFYADVHVCGSVKGVCVALHGARTLLQAVDALVAFDHPAPILPVAA